jgi:hypothetical protein
LLPIMRAQRRRHVSGIAQIVSIVSARLGG